MNEPPQSDESARRRERFTDEIISALSDRERWALSVLAAPHWLPASAVFLNLREDVLAELDELIRDDLVRITSSGGLIVPDSLREQFLSRLTGPDERRAIAERLVPVFHGRSDAESQIEAYYHELFLDPVEASRKIFRSILEWRSEPLFAHHLVQRVISVWREAFRQSRFPRAAEDYLKLVTMGGKGGTVAGNLEALEQLDPGDDPLFEAHILIRQGMQLTLLNRLDDAEARINRSYALFERLEDLVGMSSARRLLGRVAAKRDDYQTATELFLHASELAQRADRRLAAALALQGLADVAAYRGDFSESARRYEEAIASLEAIGGHTAEANIRNTYSQILIAKGELELARQHVRRAADTFGTLEQALGMANSQRVAAQIDIEAGDLAAAEAKLDKACSIYQEIGTPAGPAACAMLIGQVRQLRGEFDGAEKDYLAAQAAYEAIRDRLGSASVLRDRGALALERGDLPLATRLLSEAATRFEEIGAKAEGAAATLLLWLADDRVDPRAAARTLEQAGAVLPRLYRNVWEASPKTGGNALGWNSTPLAPS